MRKSARSDVKRHRLNEAKKARARTRGAHKAERAQKVHSKRVAQFRAQAHAELQMSMRALLLGAERAGVDIRPEHLEGRIDTEGKGSLTIADEVSPNDVKKARDAANKMFEEAKAAKEIAKTERGKCKAVRSARGKKTHAIDTTAAKAICGQTLTEPYREPDLNNWCAKCHMRWETLSA